MRQSLLLIFLFCFGSAGASESPSASPGDADRTVALLLAAPEITSLSELAGKNIAIDEAAFVSNDEARRTLGAAVNAELAGGRAKALDRLVKGEVSAAVLTLSYPETADWSSEIAGFKVFRIPLTHRPAEAGSVPADAAVSDTQLAHIPLPLPSSEARAETVDHGAASSTGKVREQMRLATIIAEHVMTLRDAEKKASASPNAGEPSVAIVVAAPEIKSVSDLTGKIVAIDDRHANSHARIQAAIVAVGATDSLLTTGETMAMDRLLSGKAPAAVLTLVYPETGFSMIEGYSVFRVPLENSGPRARL